MAYTTFVVMLALVQCIYFSSCVGSARGRLGIKAPACTGNEEFERIFRVHQNTNEQLLVFIPSIYAFSYYVSPVWGAGIGLFFILGRFIYSRAYITDPATRAPGMLITFFTNLILVLGALIGAGISLFY